MVYIDEVKVDTRGGRIKHALDCARIKQKDIAEKCGITPQAVNRWMKTNTIGLENLFILSDLTGFSARWIYTGEGHKHDIPSISESKGQYDVHNKALLQTVVQGVQDIIDTEEENWSVAKIVNEVLGLYDHFHDYEQEVLPKNVSSLISYANKKRE